MRKKAEGRGPISAARARARWTLDFKRVRFVYVAMCCWGVAVVVVACPAAAAAAAAAAAGAAYLSSMVV